MRARSTGDKNALDMLTAQPDEARNATAVLINIDLRKGQLLFYRFKIIRPVSRGDKVMRRQVAVKPYSGRAVNILFL